jgi:predicted nucleic acid-binding protein
MFDKRDQFHHEAQAKAALLGSLSVVLPWPTVYETLRTRLMRNVPALGRFERFLKSPNIIYLDDSPFRQAAMELALESSIRQKRPLSMVDCLIRLFVEDVNTQIKYLATLNVGDFADVCGANGVEII